MKPTLVIAMLLGVCLVARMAPVHAATISADMDAYVDNRAPDAPKGAWDPTNLYVYTNAADVRTLVQFDVSSIPTNASVSSAILKLQVNPGMAILGLNQAVNAYRVTTPWNDMFVTWNQANYSTPLNWTTPGGDYDATVYGSYTGSVDPYEVLTTLAIDITPIVQGWVAGTNPNYGAILTGYYASLAFYSKEVTGSGPTLEVEVVPEPIGLSLLAFGGLLLFKRR